MKQFILETKKCTSELFLNHTFDDFSFVEGSITTFNKFTIDGRLKKEFFDSPPDREYAKWSQLREYCFSLIKGRRTPLDFKLVFTLAPLEIEKLILKNSLSYRAEDVQGLYLNIHYTGEKLLCTTGTSMHLFTLDKSLEHLWDSQVQTFFKSKEIPFEADSDI